MNKNPDTLPPYFRWNFAAFLVDYICFGLALTFANLSSVMPAFVGQLTDSAPVIGLVDTVFRGGWLLPQLATARLINDKPRKKPYMLAGLSGRFLFFVIALALWSGLADRPTAMLILFFTCLGLFATTDGFGSVAWDSKANLDNSAYWKDYNGWTPGFQKELEKKFVIISLYPKMPLLAVDPGKFHYTYSEIKKAYLAYRVN